MLWLAACGYMDKKHKSVKIGGWAFTQVWALAWDIMVDVFHESQHCQHGRQNFTQLISYQLGVLRIHDTSCLYVHLGKQLTLNAF